jgi:hypothetical protein
MIVLPIPSSIYLLYRLVVEIDTYYHLYITDTTLGIHTTLGDLTEAAWPAYQPVRAHSWSPPLLAAGVVTTWSDPILWTRGTTGPASNVYGYYVTDGRAGPLLWVERAVAAPIRMSLPADTVMVLPQLTFSAL